MATAKKVNPAETLYTVNDAARELGIAPSTLRVHANSGRVHCVRASNGDRLFPASSVAAERARREA